MQPIALPVGAVPRVSVIVPAASQSERLAECLRALAAQAGGIPFETIIVLNDPTPQVERLVAERVTGATLLRSTVNLGVAGGYNRGRAAARGALLALIHDDTVPEPDWLASLVAAADELPEAGAVGGVVLDPDGSFQLAGALVWADGLTSPASTGPPTARLAVHFAPTNSLLVRTALVDASGGLDEHFYPAYYVDVDLCLSLWTLGWSVVVEPRARVRHYRGSSSSPEKRAF